MTPLLSVKHLSKRYSFDGRDIYAVKDFSLDIQEGEVVGIAGESGCGKTTLGKMIARLIEPSEGAVFFKGRNLIGMSGKETKLVRRHMQIILQDPYGSLDPRLTVEKIIAEGLRIQGIAVENRIEEILEAVDLPTSFLKRLPHELSGGQRQRVNIARALVLQPDFLVFDESVSALDISHQRQILTLLKDLQAKRNLTYMFISHDLSVLKYLCDRIAIMYRGSVVEVGAAHEVISAPKHPYTQALVSAIPVPDPIRERTRQRTILAGDPPGPTQNIPGCQFHPRCLHAQTICRTVTPTLIKGVACHFAAQE